MLEIEMKFPVQDFGAVEEFLRDRHEVTRHSRKEVDRYFNAPDRDFGSTDEALRIRSIANKNVVAYKGPKLDSQTKTRKEIEVRLADGSAAAGQFQQILTCLGYRFVAEVCKNREIAKYTQGGFNLEICLDNVKDLGLFVELEIVAPEEQMEEAKSVLMQTAEALELKVSERRSYLELLLERRKA